MMENGLEPSFPVVFFDGNTTTGMGNIFINPSFNFKLFQSMISQKIGVSPNQITTYYERRASQVSKFGGNRRSPVTNKFNFASILCDQNCFFFVVLKRSRRVRHRKHKQKSPNYSPEAYDLRFGNPNFSFSGGNFTYGALDYFDYGSEMRRRLALERDGERYLTSLNLNSNVYSDLDLISRLSIRSGEFFSDDGASSSGGASSTGAPVCDVCDSAKREGQTAPFHRCKCDAVLTSFFRSPAGPIARPVKNRVNPFGESI